MSSNVQLTSIETLVFALGVSEFNIDEIDLELLLCLDTNQERRSTTSEDDFVGVMSGFEDEGKRSLELLQNSLDKVGESDALIGLRIVNVFREDSNGLSISLTFELVSTLLEDKSESSSVGDDTIMDDAEIGLGIGPERMAVDD